MSELTPEQRKLIYDRVAANWNKVQNVGELQQLVRQEIENLKKEIEEIENKL